MRKKALHFSEADRLSILRDYFSSGMSLSACARKYNISYHTVISNWIKRYSSHPDIVSLHPSSEELDMSNRDKESYQVENAQLKKRIKELEKALAFSKLETEARDLMITIAEEHFNIPIRKKSGAKQ